MSDSAHNGHALANPAPDYGFGLGMSACLRAQAEHEPRTWFQSLRGVSPLSPEANDLYPHGVGELESAVALAALGSDWMVAHADDEQDQSIGADHLVLGPAGAFLVCSRRHPGDRIVNAGRMILVNGHRVAYVREASARADQLSEAFTLLGAADVAVRPIVALTGAIDLIRGRAKAPVPVLALGELAGWLIRHEAVYSRAQVAALAPVAGRLTGWHVRPAITSSSVRLTARFERLRTEVDAARRRYRLWIVLGAAVALAATVTMLAFAIPAIIALISG
ncbi:hypothetical protein [Salinibacterium sp. NK8237]|uniref:hypothetical protein n=1 Tax=Salinibacterium sp. NK8237 TaxID=2792038 RepID=UPI0018CF0E2E|nr:hypothetical protein [Salinibacterium sp. NK8237]MBH0131538.1 hypothetical protein [Salinibacterium sp. NK8237]